jgi:hypothetical protein
MAQEPPPAPTINNDAKPITVTADEALGWTEDNLHVLLVRGNVIVEQGLNRVKMKEAILWLSAKEPPKNTPLPVLLYGEGNVLLEQGGSQWKRDKIVLEWRTLGEFNLKSKQQLGRASPEDPFYRRAMAERQTFLNTQPPQPKADTPTATPPTTSQKPDGPPVALPAKRQVTPPGQPPMGGNPPPPSPPPAGPLGFAARARRLQVAPRGSTGFDSRNFPLGPDLQAVVITGGVNIFVDDETSGMIVDIGTDRAVIWIREKNGQQLSSNLRNSQFTTKEQLEFYLEGHVEIRQASTRGPQAGLTRLIQADAAYYDVSRDVAIMTNSRITLTQKNLPATIQIDAREIRQVGMGHFEASEAELSSSRLPSDPGLRIQATSISLEERTGPRLNIFGRPITTLDGDDTKEEKQWHAIADEVTFRVFDLPVGYLPHIEGDPREPLGPLRNLRVKSDRVFGPSVQATWDMFSLLGRDKPKETKWDLETDYFGRRGPAIGTDFQTTGTGLFGFPGRYWTQAKGYIIQDHGTDILGGPRTYEPPRELRGLALFRHRQELDEHWTFQGQFAYLSDRNFLEQYYKRQFDEEPNQETYAYLKYQNGNAALTFTAQPHLRWWVTETEKLPDVHGYLIGYDFFNLLTYYGRSSAGYYRFRPSHDVLDSYLATPFSDEFQRVRPLPPSSDLPHSGDLNLARFDLFQELDLPFNVGPLKVVPYGLLDLTYYSDDLTGNDASRAWYGGGVRANLPLTRIYSDVYSSLFNLNGLAHKINFEADYRYVRSNVDFRQLPLLDRLDDDTTDQARRDLRLMRLGVIPPLTSTQLRDLNLATNPLFDPQLYALRAGLDRYPENLDDLQYLRMGIRQRWQTKRGLPGQEHTVDWITLNLEGTYFPQSERDNFGHPFGLLQYDFTWHIGDRTTLVSSGLMDPFSGGARVFNAGIFIERPERLQFYLGYRLIDPVGSDAIIAATTYQLSQKYTVTMSTSYDFGGLRNLGNSIVFTRIGSDFVVSFGVNYEALRNNFGLTLEVYPTLSAPQKRLGGPLLTGQERSRL